MVGGFDGVGGNLFELGADVVCEVAVLVVLVEVFLEVMVAQFVAVLVLAVFVAVDLDGVVGEMNELVGGIVQLVLKAAGPNVALVVPIPLDRPVLSYSQSTSRTSSM